MMEGVSNILAREYSEESVIDRMDRIRAEMDECAENPTEENKNRRNELMWAHFMAGLRLSSGNIYF